MEDGVVVKTNAVQLVAIRSGQAAQPLEAIWSRFPGREEHCVDDSSCIADSAKYIFVPLQGDSAGLP